MRDRKINVLFVSRRGDARSLLAGACLQHVGGPRFRVAACGEPGELAREPHPLVAVTLQRAHIEAPPLKVQDWDGFRRVGARRFDFVITLDAEVERRRPAWPGQPTVALWEYPDLLAHQESGEALEPQFSRMLLSLRRRLDLLVSLSQREASRADLRSDVRDLAFVS